MRLAACHRRCHRHFHRQGHRHCHHQKELKRSRYRAFTANVCFFRCQSSHESRLFVTLIKAFLNLNRFSVDWEGCASGSVRPCPAVSNLQAVFRPRPGRVRAASGPVQPSPGVHGWLAVTCHSTVPPLFGHTTFNHRCRRPFFESSDSSFRDRVGFCAFVSCVQFNS